MRAISENRFYDYYKPLPNPIVNAKNLSLQPEDLWEHDQTLAYPLEQVWTIIEDDYGRNLYACPGYHIVNKLGYVVTEKPWTDPGRDALYFGR